MKEDTTITSATRLFEIEGELYELDDLIEKIEPVWTVKYNTDQTEGRGDTVYESCTSKATALRIAKGKGGMGTDAEVMIMHSVVLKNPKRKHFRQRLVPGWVHTPTHDDRLMDEELHKISLLKTKLDSLELTEAEKQTLRKMYGGK